MKAAATHEDIALTREQARGVDALFASVDQPGHPGAAVAIVRNGQLAYQRCFGLANLEDQVPVTPQTVFRLGSTSKHVCATAILLLEQRGLLAIHDPVAKHIPEMPACAAGMTLEHLLTMTSGLHDGIALTIFAGRGHLALTRAQHLELVSRYDELMFEPGTQLLYSNTNYALLSLVIERVSGRSLADFLATEIFQPLGLTSARLTERMVETVPRKSRGYVPGKEPGRFETGLILYETSGDGGIDLSIEDFVRWFQNYRDDRLVGKNYRQRMEVEIRLPNGMPTGYALGLNRTHYRGGLKISHAGGMPGHLADFCFYPELDCGVLMLSNWMDPGLLALGDRIVDLLIGEVAQPAASAAPPGFYLCAERGMALEIQDTAAGSMCYLLGDASLLSGSDAQGYQPRKCAMGFRIEPVTAAHEIAVSFGSGSPAVFGRWSAPAQSQPLEEFIGRYRSPLLGEVHHVRVGTGGRLEMTLDSALRRLAWQECTWRAPDVFSASVVGEPTQTNLIARFVRDAGGGVSGLRYSTYRCRGVLFERDTA
jgi:CubicO group peptidase (beta-lactamase class C family)